MNRYPTAPAVCRHGPGDESPPDYSNEDARAEWLHQQAVNRIADMDADDIATELYEANADYFERFAKGET